MRKQPIQLHIAPQCIAVIGKRQCNETPSSQPTPDYAKWNSVLQLLIRRDRKSTRLNSSHSQISYAVFCLKKKKKHDHTANRTNPFLLFSRPPSQAAYYDYYERRSTDLTPVRLNVPTSPCTCTIYHVHVSI